MADQERKDAPAEDDDELTREMAQLDPDFVRRLSHLVDDPPVVEGQWFFQQEVRLDGRRFVRCFFDSCTLVIESGVFGFEHCKLQACLFHFTGPAETVGKTLAVGMRMHRVLSDEQWAVFPPTLKPIVNDDGTLSW